MCGCRNGRKRPNGLAFSCRERATGSRQNTYDLAREAVSCNAVLDAAPISVRDGLRTGYFLTRDLRLTIASASVVYLSKRNHSTMHPQTVPAPSYGHPSTRYAAHRSRLG